MNSNWKSSVKRRNSCTLCFVGPLISCSKVFALNVTSPCACQLQDDDKDSRYYYVYTIIIEIFLWISFSWGFLQILNLDFLCGSLFGIFKQDIALMIKLAFLVSYLYMAVQFSIITRNKLPMYKYTRILALKVDVKSKVEPLFFIALILYSATVLMFVLGNVILMYPNIYKQNKMALFCTLKSTVWFTFGTAHIILTAITSITMLFTLYMIFKKLSDQLDERHGKETDIRKFLGNFMQYQSDCWDAILNNLWRYLLPTMYICFVCLTCLLVYAVVFGDVTTPSGRAILFFALLTSSGVLLAACGISRWASSIYGNFISINKLSSADLSELEKLEVLNFMKRYGKTPIGISINGFFFVKRNFLLRVANALYSGYSSLLKLRGMNDKKECGTNFRMENTPFQNVTNTS